MRNSVRIALAALVLLAFVTPAGAQETQPGDACTTADEFARIGGPENPGSGHFLVCDGAIWQPVLRYFQDGNVLFGSGGTAAAPLHVWGEAIIGSNGLACAAAAEGALRYTSSSDSWEFCDGASWLDLATGSGAAAAAGSDRQIQFNSGGSLAAESGLAYSSAGSLNIGLFSTETASDPSFNVGAYRLRLVGESGSPADFLLSGYAEKSDIDITYARGSEGSPADVQIGDSIGSIRFSGFRSGGYDGAAAIVAEVSGLPGSTGVRGDLVFRTADVNSSNEVMRITSKGNVGIGTASPAGLLEVGSGLFYVSSDGYVGIGTGSPAASIPTDRLHVKTAGGNAVQYSLMLQNPDNTDGGGTATGILFEAHVATVGNPEFGKGALVYERQNSYGRGDFHFLQQFGINNNNPTLSHSVMTIKNDGKVGIGTTSPSHVLHITGPGRSTQSSWDTSSDARVKTGISTIENGLETVLRLRPVTYEYMPEYRQGSEALSGLRRGFIAQEVETVLPNAVTRTEEPVGDGTIPDFRVLRHDDFVPLLISAVKEQQAQIEALRTVLEEQRAANDAQQAQIDRLLREVSALKAQMPPAAREAAFPQ